MIKRVFVTVGTTEFDALVEAATQFDLLSLLADLGCTQLSLQIGRGRLEPTDAAHPSIELSFFRFKDSLADDLAAADLVIGHAGAGTCLECLDLGKRLVVVVNESLHDNHQAELAERLARDRHLFYCTPDALADTLRAADFRSLKPLSPGRPDKLVDWLEDYLGLPKSR